MLKRQGEVDTLLAKCAQLETFGDVKEPVAQLQEQLEGLRMVMAEVGDLVRERAHVLQVRHV